MNKELAMLAMEFLLRVDLKGSETPKFMAVMAQLERIAVGIPEPVSSANPGESGYVDQ